MRPSLQLLSTAAFAAAVATPVRAQHAASGVEGMAQVQALSAQLVATRSATQTLEAWCRDHHLAADPRIVAHAIRSEDTPPTPEQRRRLEVTDREEVKHRRVELQCGTHVLSQADNWYVPSRLTTEMNRLLNATDTPFGRAVAPLEPTRETLAVRMRWSDSDTPIPDALFEHRAVLYTKDHRPFSEVAETYRRELLAFDVSAGSDGAAAIRAARTAQNNAIAVGDAGRAASFWTDDVTVRRALGQTVNGRDAARQALESAGTSETRLVYQRLTGTVDLSARWPLAFETGTWEGHLGVVTGPTVINGRFSAQWVRRGDRWLIRSEVFVALTCSGVGCESVAVP